MFRAAFIVFPLLFIGCSDPAGLGGPCSSDDDCESGLECLGELPGGMCSSACDEECPDGGLCIDLAGQGYCFPACDSRGDCRDGYTCSMGHCDLPCANDDECPEHAECHDDGCRYRDDQPLGAACVMDEQCRSGQCHLDGLTGYCSGPCGGSEFCADSGCFYCGMFGTETERTEALCRRPAGAARAGDLCGSGSDCGSGICAEGACVFPCGAAGSCDSGAVCDSRSADVEGFESRVDYCDLSTAPGVRLDDLGVLETDAGCVHIEFDAPDDIVSFAVVAWTDENVVIQPRSLYGPEDRELIDDHGLGTIRVYERAREVTVIVPNTDYETGWALPGHYEMDLCTKEVDGPMLVDASLHVRVLMKVREGGVCEDGQLTLNVHLAPRVYGPMSAANAADSPYVQDILERVRRFYEYLCHVTLEDVRYFDLDESYGLIASEAELYGMFHDETVDTPPASVNVFIVRDLSGVAEWVAGISGGLPGPPGVGGTVHSGVAVQANEDARTAGDTMAHELGHFLGLYHPTEMNGVSQDTISDTPTCSFDPEEWMEIAACPTVTNIMFPMLMPFMEQISEGQCFVVRANQGL